MSRSRHVPVAQQNGKEKRSAEMIHAHVAAARSTSAAMVSKDCSPFSFSRVIQGVTPFSTSKLHFCGKRFPWGKCRHVLLGGNCESAKRAGISPMEIAY